MTHAAAHGGLSRSVQRTMLDKLAEVYPHRVDLQEVLNLPFGVLAANLIYLEEHGLCEANAVHHTSLGGSSGLSLGDQRITARGIDFLADDGGLSAILGVVTVKLHAETLLDLISSRVDESGATPEEKSAIKKHFYSLSEAGLQETTKALVREGLARIPELLPWLHMHSGL